MKYILALLIAFAGSAHAYPVLPAPGSPGAPDDPRYCGTPDREKNGRISRSEKQKARFAAVWPMPQDGQVWYIDHVLPRDQGGCDLPVNMQWLPARLKTCATWCKDRFERCVYAVSRNCKLPKRTRRT